MEIPYSSEVRPDTGLSNGTLGMWLFIASEVMFFGALFSAYALLRTGSTEWPRGLERLGLMLPASNTVLLTVSSVIMVRGGRAASAGRRRQARRLLAAAAALGALFLCVKGYEWSAHIGAGQVPASDTFMAIYYTLTGVHAVHVLGGVAVVAYLSVTAPVSRSAAGNSRSNETGLASGFGRPASALSDAASRIPEPGLVLSSGAAGSDRFATRVRLAGLYWLFVEAVWLILFTTVYLL